MRKKITLILVIITLLISNISIFYSVSEINEETTTTEKNGISIYEK